MNASALFTEPGPGAAPGQRRRPAGLLRVRGDARVGVDAAAAARGAAGHDGAGRVLAVPAHRAAAVLPSGAAQRRAGGARRGQRVRPGAAARRPDQRVARLLGQQHRPRRVPAARLRATCRRRPGTTWSGWSRRISPARPSGTRRSASASPAVSCSRWSGGSLGDPFFGVHLNPGHFIHLDEWPSSPVYSGSGVVLTSGMTLQLDIIPATGTVYHTTNIEDGVALADEAGPAPSSPPATRACGTGSPAAARSWPTCSGSRSGRRCCRSRTWPATSRRSGSPAAGHAQALTAALRDPAGARAAATTPGRAWYQRVRRWSARRSRPPAAPR